MRLRDNVSVAWQSLARTKSRAALTMLGIVIGIASVILMLAIGRSAESFLLSQVASFGSDLIIVTNGRGDVKRGDPAQSIIKQTLTYDDYQSLRRAPWVKAANINVINRDIVGYGSVSGFASVYGSSPDEIRIYPAEASQGRFLDDADVEARARVAVIGQAVAEKLFGQQDPLSASIKINRRPFRVIGVMAQGGKRFFTNLDEIVYIPVTAAMDLYNRDRANFISFKPAVGVSMDDAQERVRLLYRDTHSLNNPQGILSKDDFRVLTQEDAIRNAGTIGMILQILLASIAAISLIVGGIGIMNIMFVTVTERTQEIGLRKALGATSRDVLGQFLAEAIMLTVLGGIVGIICGVGLSALSIRIIATFQEGWTFQFPAQGIALAFGVSAAIGVIFGYYPARQAARLHPIESLRYE